MIGVFRPLTRRLKQHISPPGHKSIYLRNRPVFDAAWTPSFLDPLLPCPFLVVMPVHSYVILGTPPLTGPSYGSPIQWFPCGLSIDSCIYLPHASTLPVQIAYPRSFSKRRRRRWKHLLQLSLLVTPKLDAPRTDKHDGVWRLSVEHCAHIIYGRYQRSSNNVVLRWQAFRADRALSIVKQHIADVTPSTEKVAFQSVRDFLKTRRKDLITRNLLWPPLDPGSCGSYCM